MNTRFWEKVHNNIVLQVIVFCFGMLLLFGCYLICMKVIISRRDSQEFLALDTEIGSYVYRDLESMEKHDEKIFFSGWALRVNANTKRMYLLLKSGEEERMYPLKNSVRKDIGKYYFREDMELECGYSIGIDEKELDKASCYEVQLCICYEDTRGLLNRVKVSTGKYIYNGELFDYNPKEFYEPYLEDKYAYVVREGVLKAYDIEQKCWIYLYEGKLYYFIGNSFDDMIDSRQLAIPVMPSTSMLSMLPEHRKQHGMDHLGAYSFGEICGNSNEEVYHVQIVDLTTNYPMTFISTGIYSTNEKEWVVHFTIPMFDWRECDY